MKIKAKGSSFVRGTIQTIILAVACVFLGNVLAHADTFLLGTTNSYEGPNAGADSVVLGASLTTSGWTNTANDSWLHLSAENETGEGSTNIIFTFDANPGDTRIGTLTIAGQTLTVTQAGEAYIPANGPVYLAAAPAYQGAGAVTLDGAGNLYFLATSPSAEIVMVPANHTPITNLFTVSISGFLGLAADPVGDLYYTSGSKVMFWSAATSNSTPFITNGLTKPYALALDNLGNLYIVDGSTIKEWTASNSELTTIITNASMPTVAVDAAGNVYFVNGSGLQEWNPASGNQTTLYQPPSVLSRIAVDGGGNVYFNGYSGDDTNKVMKLSAVDGSVSLFAIDPFRLTVAGIGGIAADPSGSVFFTPGGQGNPYPLQMAPRAYVPGPTSEGLAAGTDQLSPVLAPYTINYQPSFPTSDRNWLTVNGATNGVISFSFQDAVSNRTGHINIFGQFVPIAQYATPSYVWATPALAEPPTAGTDSITLIVQPEFAAWTVTNDSSWLHLPVSSGAGSTNLVFSFDANSGSTRIGTLTVAGQTFTITQAGNTYVLAGIGTNFATFGNGYPVVVDQSDDVYLGSNNSIAKWARASNSISLFITNLPSQPIGLALDPSGNAYLNLAGSGIYYWNAVSNQLTSVYSGTPAGSVALDSSGNLYFIVNSIHYFSTEIVAGTKTPVGMGFVTGPVGFAYLALDKVGNLYAPGNSGGIQKWSEADNTISQLYTGVETSPAAIAVDSGGNVYVSDRNVGLEVWFAATGTFAKLSPYGGNPDGLAVDGERNVYVGDGELPRVFVDPTPKFEPATAGSDVLPPVLPLDADLLPPFTPTSDQSWLSIGIATNAVVSFSFTANTNYTNRTAHINLFGQSIAVTQSASVAPPQITGASLSGSGVFQFNFSNNVAGSSFTVLSTTNLLLPLTDWTAVGSFSNAAAGQLQFTIPVSTNEPERYYSVRSP